jgi:capsular polysaccharide transport system permease protein
MCAVAFVTGFGFALCVINRNNRQTPSRRRSVDNPDTGNNRQPGAGPENAAQRPAARPAGPAAKPRAKPADRPTAPELPPIAGPARLRQRHLSLMAIFGFLVILPSVLAAA